MKSERVLVYCANGFQGGPITTALLGAGCRVRALVRDEQRAAALRQAGAELAFADLDDDVAFRRAHNDVGTVLMQFPTGNQPDMTISRARRTLEIVHDAGIGNVILNTSVQYPRHVDELPSFAASREIERLVVASGLRVAVIRPTFLLSNLLLPWAAQSVALAGVLAYPVAQEHALTWTAPVDIGRLAAIAVGDGLYGRTLQAGGERAVTGPQLAETFSRALNREISYVALDPGDFERGVDEAIGPGVGAQVGRIFRFIQDHPDDLAFVSTPYQAPPGFPAFEPTSQEAWVTAHRDAFSA